MSKRVVKLLLVLFASCCLLPLFTASQAEAHGPRYYARRLHVAHAYRHAVPRHYGYHHGVRVVVPRAAVYVEPRVRVVVPRAAVYVGPGVQVYAYPGIHVNIPGYGWPY